MKMNWKNGVYVISKVRAFVWFQHIFSGFVGENFPMRKKNTAFSTEKTSSYGLVVVRAVNKDNCHWMFAEFLWKNEPTDLFAKMVHCFSLASAQKPLQTPARFSQNLRLLLVLFFFASVFFMWMQHVSLPLLKKSTANHRRANQKSHRQCVVLCRSFLTLRTRF